MSRQAGRHGESSCRGDRQAGRSGEGSQSSKDRSMGDRAPVFSLIEAGRAARGGKGARECAAAAAVKVEARE